jgi:hypothetical protein
MRADFNLQFNTSRSVGDAIAVIEREFNPSIVQHRGFKVLPRSGNRLAYARRRWGRELALAAAGGVVGGALENLGPVGDVAGWGTEGQTLLWNSSERIVFTVTAHSGGSTINVGGRADLPARQLVDHVVGGLKAASRNRQVCARCQAPTDGALWCSSCCARLDARKIDPADGSQIMSTAGLYKEMCESGATDRFFDVFAFDVIAEYPDEGKTVSRAELEALLERTLPVLKGAEMLLEAAFGDGDSYWLAWHLKHPRSARPRFVEHVRLNAEGRVSAVSVYSV